MKKHIVAGFLALSIFVPLVSFAQADIDPNPDTSACITLNNNMRYRSRDITTNGEVSDLQDFLQSGGYLNSEPTGYFGLLTLTAVKNFQTANGISPTGFIGPITRAKIKTLTCTEATNSSNSNSDWNSSSSSTGQAQPCSTGVAYSTLTGQPCNNTSVKVLISSLSPVLGSQGTTVVINGTGFATDIICTGTVCPGSYEQPNTIHFGANATIKNVYSGDGKTLTFAVPYSNDSPFPGAMATAITLGDYQVYVTNSRGTSNSVNFFVPAADPQ